MEVLAYILCAAIALLCAAALLKGYWQSRTPLLLWCGLFFAVMVVENVILFYDVVVVPDTDLLLVRRLVALAGALVLVYGLTRDVK